ncbi:MAG: hypothetical protein R2809_14635 [Flavobacteriales bacterium]
MIRLLLTAAILSIAAITKANHPSAAAAKDSLHYLVGDDLGEIKGYALIKFANEAKGDVIIRVLNANNEVEKEYVDASVEPGFHQAFIDVKELDPGSYSIVLIHFHHRRTTRFIKVV